MIILDNMIKKIRNKKGQFVKKQKKKVFCNFCNKSFYVSEYRISIGDGKFCSQSCSSKNQPNGKDSPIYGNTFRKGVILSDETKNKISLSKTGKKMDKEMVRKRNIKVGLANKGKSFCEEAKRKSIIALKLRVGKLHPRWIEDRSKLKRYTGSEERRSPAYKFWRKEVFERDNYKCRICNKDCNGKIEAHHILSWSKHSELRYEVNNGITLCHFHHPFKVEEEKRLIPKLQELVSVLNE